jgi:hypothetical protein
MLSSEQLGGLARNRQYLPSMMRRPTQREILHRLTHAKTQVQQCC